ncbi:serine hydrolase [Deinococcus sp.]|uniref:serine hydrolase n=1 Tax=Deinococcus sp. TaxID=47478 RepID=UPI0025C08F3D|nr:serine hydrolase [Deinococcus sp.]
MIWQASTIKVPLLVLALQAVQARVLDLDGRVVIQASDRVPGAGVLHQLGAGLAPSWRDVLMIAVSHHTAANLLIDRLGVTEINMNFGRLGLRNTRQVGKLELRLSNGLIQGEWLGKPLTALFPCWNVSRSAT